MFTVSGGAGKYFEVGVSGSGSEESTSASARVRIVHCCLFLEGRASLSHEQAFNKAKTKQQKRFLPFCRLLRWENLNPKKSAGVLYYFGTGSLFTD